MKIRVVALIIFLFLFDLALGPSYAADAHRCANSAWLSRPYRDR